MTPMLVLLNGIPASGKSTLARRWCDLHASELPLCLDIDAIRAMLGGWREQLQPAGLSARDIAVVAIAAHLASGRDVLVPQYLQRADFVDRLRGLGADHGSSFLEVVLTVDVETAQSRFDARAARAGAAETWGRLPSDLSTVADDFERFLGGRPGVVRIQQGQHALGELDAIIARARFSVH